MHLPTVIRRLCRLLLLLCCCWLLTGPQLLLQLGAWSWMMASYSQESSIEQALAETFGGERPCELCKLITAVETEQQTAPAKRTGRSHKSQAPARAGTAHPYRAQLLYRCQAQPHRSLRSATGHRRAHPAAATRLTPAHTTGDKRRAFACKVPLTAPHTAPAHSDAP